MPIFHFLLTRCTLIFAFETAFQAFSEDALILYSCISTHLATSIFNLRRNLAIALSSHPHPYPIFPSISSSPWNNSLHPYSLDVMPKVVAHNLLSNVLTQTVSSWVLSILVMSPLDSHVASSSNTTLSHQRRWTNSIIMQDNNERQLTRQDNNKKKQKN